MYLPQVPAPYWDPTCFRIVASGAAGGTLWGDDPAEAAQEHQVQNYGTEIEAVFNLTRNDQLLLVVGQRGESPCQAFKREPYKPFRFRTKVTIGSTTFDPDTL